MSLQYKYRCHINVEVCVSNQAIYDLSMDLYKYLYEGPDQRCVRTLAQVLVRIHVQVVNGLVGDTHLHGYVALVFAEEGH
jgi:hypothetical protein